MQIILIVVAVACFLIGTISVWPYTNWRKKPGHDVIRVIVWLAGWEAALSLALIAFHHFRT